jgi:hypothetical protein
MLTLRPTGLSRSRPASPAERGCGEDRVAAAIGVGKFEAITRIPREMSDAAAQVIEEGDRPEEQQQHPDRRNEEGVGCCKQFAARGHSHEPPGEQDRADGQRNAGEAVQDRQGRRDLKPVPPPQRATGVMRVTCPYV